MQIQSTSIEPISETQSRVDIVLADQADEALATTYLRMRCTIEHPENPILASVQAIALRYVRQLIASETQRLVPLSGLSETYLRGLDERAQHGQLS